MGKKFQNYIRKLFQTRLNLENELLKCHSLLLEYIENNNRTAKLDYAIYKRKIASEKAVDVNEQSIMLAGKKRKTLTKLLLSKTFGLRK